MKKLFSCLLAFPLSCGSTISLFSCQNLTRNKPHLPPIKPKKPVIKDIFYYEQLKQEITEEIKEYDDVIKDIENNKNEYESEDDYQDELKQEQTEQLIKKAELNDCEYQILVCQKHNEFTSEQKKEAIMLLENKINNLNNALNLLNQIKNKDFDQQEQIKGITIIINVVNTLLDEIKSN